MTGEYDTTWQLIHISMTLLYSLNKLYMNGKTKRIRMIGNSCFVYI